MIENALQSIGGVGIFGIVSICLFFAFFSGVLIWAARLKKSYLNSMGGLPLDEEQSLQTPSGNCVRTASRPRLAAAANVESRSSLFNALRADERAASRGRLAVRTRATMPLDEEPTSQTRREADSQNRHE